jgi:hypothetical protein
MTITTRRAVLHEAIDGLTENELDELATYITYLQWKTQSSSTNSTARLSSEKPDTETKIETEKPSPYRPVTFPTGIIRGFDFSLEFIAQARRELWGRLGDNGL